MKINVTKPLLDYEGKPVLNPQEPPEAGSTTMPERTPSTPRGIIFQALNSAEQNEVITPENKAKYFHITQLVYKTKEVSFTRSQENIIIERVGKFYGPLIYGRILELFGDEEIEEYEERPKKPKKAAEPEEPSPPETA